MVKQIVLALTLTFALAGAAHATQGGEGNNTQCNGVGNVNSPCGGGGAGGAGGAASVTNTNTFKPTNTNVGINQQDQSQRQRQNQKQYQGQGQEQNNDQTIAPSQSVRFEQVRQSPVVVAPSLTAAGTGVCLGSISGGVSVWGAGASFGTTKIDKGCERRSAAALLYQMGHRDAALKLLSLDPEVREAMGLVPVRAVAVEAATVSPAALFNQQGQ